MSRCGGFGVQTITTPFLEHHLLGPSRHALLVPAKRMADGCLELTWNLKSATASKKRKTGRLAGTTARPPRVQHSRGFDLATEAQAMMARTAFDADLKEWAGASPRGAEVAAVMQAILSELRRVGGDAFMADDNQCKVRAPSPHSFATAADLHAARVTPTRTLEPCAGTAQQAARHGLCGSHDPPGTASLC